MGGVVSKPKAPAPAPEPAPVRPAPVQSTQEERQLAARRRARMSGRALLGSPIGSRDEQLQTTLGVG
jgi:hypothetical protein